MAISGLCVCVCVCGRYLFTSSHSQVHDHQAYMCTGTKPCTRVVCCCMCGSGPGCPAVVKVRQAPSYELLSIWTAMDTCSFEHARVQLGVACNQRKVGNVVDWEIITSEKNAPNA